MLSDEPAPSVSLISQMQLSPSRAFEATETGTTSCRRAYIYSMQSYVIG